VSERFPDFLYIGASKAGSTWLAQILHEHPEVFVPAAKGIWFFDRCYDRGPEWYASFFRVGPERVVGELSHDYFLSPVYAARIESLLPDVKLIVCLREPCDWASSWYLQKRAEGLSRERDVDEFAERPDVVRHVDYFANLKPFYDLFPARNIHVRFFDDLCADALTYVREIFTFIGADPAFDPPSIDRRIHTAREPRLNALGVASFRVAQLMRRRGFGNAVGAVARTPAFERLLFRRVSRKPELSATAARRLREPMAEGYDALEELIGRPLPPAWRG